MKKEVCRHLEERRVLQGLNQWGGFQEEEGSGRSPLVSTARRCGVGLYGEVVLSPVL